MLNPMKLWRRSQRHTDLQILWPQCKELAESLEHARALFTIHVTHDPAWTKDYTLEELRQVIGALT